MVFYEINNKKFANPYAAFLYGAHNCPHKFPKFNLYDENFSKFDWTRSPAESFQLLCDRRAFQLREKYEKLILCFSGGTDSTTIYNTFMRNNIYIDEIYVNVSRPGISKDTEHWQNQLVLEWLHKNHSKDTRIIAEYTQTFEEANRAASRFDSQYHITSPELNSHFRFHNHLFDASLNKKNFNQNKNYCLIAGYEKPRLVFKHGRYYFNFVDSTFCLAMMRPDIEFFFVTPDLPELHCKQCHMLIDTVENLGITLAEINSIENYYIKSAAVGRDPEIFYGTSQKEKLICIDYASIIHNINFDSKLPAWVESWTKRNPAALTMHQALQQNTNQWKNYTRQWSSLQTDQTLINYLVRHKILDDASTPIQGYNNIISKYHLVK